MLIDPIRLTFSLHIMLLSFIGLILLLKYWEWLPIILLPLIWYLPGWTAPGGLLEHVKMARWFMSLVVPFLFLIQLGKNAVSGQPLKVPVIKEPLFALIILSMLSALINASGFLTLLGYLTTCLPYPLFFIILMNIDLSDSVVMWFTGLFLFLTFIQVPEILFRYLTLGIIGDSVSLTLGVFGQYNMGIFSLYVIALIVAHALATKIRLLHLVACALLLVCSVIGEVKVVAVTVPIVIIAVVLAHLRKLSFHGYDISGYVNKLIVGICAVLLILPVYQSWSKIQKGRNDCLTLFYNDMSHLASGNQPSARKDIYKINRIGTLIKAWDVSKDKPLNLIFGFGPGSSFAGQFFDSRGRFLTLLNLPKWEVLPQISSTFGDIGLIGLFIHFWIFIRFFKYLLLAHLKATSVFYETLFAGSFGVWVFYVILGPIYNIVWRHDVASFIFYFFMAVAYKQVAQNAQSDIIDHH